MAKRKTGTNEKTNRLFQVMEYKPDEKSNTQNMIDNINAWIEEATGSTLVDDYAEFQQHIETQIEEAKQKAEEHKRMQFALQNRLKILKEQLLAFMTDIDKDKIVSNSGHYFEIYLGPPTLTINDGYNENNIPDEFVRIKREVNKLAIRAALRAGKELEFAHYDEPNRFFRGK